LAGFGVVGQSFAKILLSRASDLYTLYGINPKIVACLDKEGSAVSQTGLDLHRLLGAKMSKGTVAAYDNNPSKASLTSIMESVEAEILIEMTPTNLDDAEPGLTNIISGMRAGKHIITVNKGPLALAFPSLIELAHYNNIMFRFSGTVGGGTPILEFAKRCLNGDRIISFKGILNGTTNYILSKMNEGLNFDDALNDAKIKGYAEASPMLDLEGYDAASKLVIMANWIMGLKVTIRDVKREGITHIGLPEINRAAVENNSIKLIAYCDNKRLEVKPTMIQKNDPICVNGTLNAVTFCSEYSGDKTIIGRGAGGMETASSIIRDLIEIRESIIENNL
jgi:homoserine dehydrogenase